MNAKEIARYFDSTNLKLDATEPDLILLCEEAAALGCATVCLYPSNVSLAVERLSGSEVKVATVIGFPSGRFSTKAKAEEIRAAFHAGANDMDIVMDYPALREGKVDLVSRELDALCGLCRELGVLSKIIVETCFLNLDQRMTALQICEDSGADFIKTSTGFGTAGAQLADVKAWADKRRSIKIKASGGIRTFADAKALIDAGAERLGLSAAGAIIQELEGQAPEEVSSSY
ncbi:deoxyribose-phosphate aldolase [Rubellicoccus peritrichatus]|uniref:Deoxyribose-phosphate aldolase n=1 Tax=Rubellicoccus peritrichatus TaxID=3080537 RepID=A0AAQ3LGX3_9BACT|nr:deoxyribose-phosphate aldolase [Puniceicoccus sp. CR14]WOO41944.1 deoxyribose-phosphate aldolase [Puniceicoccus sp. CR14]